ncbi:Gfo/Idh/MocA family oxidoreductase [Methanomicrobium antiquum]|uniref:Gfo/Idh/MocA family oxidoreductase n=1 Tax=Methanomicrobium antiquum TaxID=487686 RepID=A0AAF0FSP3_9EURY|nr:Gfo/Idh/MocA family oxidoreductase [Methanomicrobium antiquum]WFN37411.1 Gfo/Idh/MocA family oxidoreductase [Methanomicrobium antiquum]
MDVGVIGTGIMGKNHARIYSELKGVDSVKVFDLNEKSAKSVAETIEGEAVTSVEKLLKGVDCVSMCVPTPYHFETAKRVADFGVGMLIEKPICLNSKEGDELLKIFPKDLIVGVGHIERFNPIISEILRIITNPIYIEIQRHNPASARVTGSSVLEDLMIHDIDLIQNMFTDKKCRIAGCSGNFDVFSALFESNGTTISLSASRKSSKKIRSMYVEEEEFTVEGDFMSRDVYIHRKPENYSIEHDRYVQENIVEKVLVNKDEPLKVELKTFIDCIKTGKQFPVTPQQANDNLKTCEELKRRCHLKEA